jgi:hypothetical protein
VGILQEKIQLRNNFLERITILDMSMNILTFQGKECIEIRLWNQWDRSKMHLFFNPFTSNENLTYSYIHNLTT